MTYKAHIKNGVAVLDQGASLPEGSEVLVEPVASPAPPAKLFAAVSGKGKDLPSDGSVQHDHYIYGTPH